MATEENQITDPVQTENAAETTTSSEATAVTENGTVDTVTNADSDSLDPKNPTVSDSDDTSPDDAASSTKKGSRSKTKKNTADKTVSYSVKVKNNGDKRVIEPLTSTYLPAGQMTEIEVESAAKLEQVQSNLTQLKNFGRLLEF